MFHVFKTAHFQFETVDLEMHFSMVLFFSLENRQIMGFNPVANDGCVHCDLKWYKGGDQPIIAVLALAQNMSILRTLFRGLVLQKQAGGLGMCQIM